MHGVRERRGGVRSDEGGGRPWHTLEGRGGRIIGDDVDGRSAGCDANRPEEVGDRLSTAVEVVPPGGGAPTTMADSPSSSDRASIPVSISRTMVYIPFFSPI